MIIIMTVIQLCLSVMQRQIITILFHLLSIFRPTLNWLQLPTGKQSQKNDDEDDDGDDEDEEADDGGDEEDGDNDDGGGGDDKLT